MKLPSFKAERKTINYTKYFMNKLDKNQKVSTKDLKIYNQLSVASLCSGKVKNLHEAFTRFDDFQNTLSIIKTSLTKNPKL